MTEIPFHLREVDDPLSAIERIESVIARYSLLTTMKGTLKSYPGCTHWHCKLGRETGTLEITLWPAKRRAWFKVQAGRRARWIDEVVPKMKQMLEA
ncbi:MAG: hypothetical protein H7Z14_22610 [Anaerolineae bacterium]|nr:hypothetical protein [Phycisphaerae bacterium]